MTEHIGHRQLYAGFAGFPNQLRNEDRVAAEMEEAVVQDNALWI